MIVLVLVMTVMELVIKELVMIVMEVVIEMVVILFPVLHKPFSLSLSNPINTRDMLNASLKWWSPLTLALSEFHVCLLYAWFLDKESMNEHRKMPRTSQAQTRNACNSSG